MSDSLGFISSILVQGRGKGRVGRRMGGHEAERENRDRRNGEGEERRGSTDGEGERSQGQSGGRRLSSFSIGIRREHTGGLLRVGYLICGIVR